MNLSQIVEADEDVESAPTGDAGWEGADRLFTALDRTEVLIVARSVTFSVCIGSRESPRASAMARCTHRWPPS